MLYPVRQFVISCYSTEDHSKKASLVQAQLFLAACLTVLSHIETVSVQGILLDFLQAHTRTHVHAYTHNQHAHIRTHCKMHLNDEQLVRFCSSERQPCKRVTTCLPACTAASKWFLLYLTPAGVARALQLHSSARSFPWTDNVIPHNSCHQEITGHTVTKGTKLSQLFL